MENNLTHFTQDIQLFSIQILDFKTADGEIKGYKLYYTTQATGDFKDNYLGGKCSECFIKDDHYSDTLKPFISKVRPLPVKAKLNLELVSTDKPLKAVSFSL